MDMIEDERKMCMITGQFGDGNTQIAVPVEYPFEVIVSSFNDVSPNRMCWVFRISINIVCDFVPVVNFEP